MVSFALDSRPPNWFSRDAQHVNLDTASPTTSMSKRGGKSHGENLVSTIDDFVIDNDRTGRRACGPNYLDTRVSDRSFRLGGSEPRNVGAAGCRSLSSRCL